ncbi:Putative peptidase S8/S53 domain-containing protein [Colletotrichum destructivum]|uniref:Peptidase S8/S53 domain-containing protein n=1 Tax=Colletotrichum destructivum TaxID=34406 RepID=A0AAX4IGW2_9PEZI|nr:Putative peptidase S8/S53 domain-containing protein [Colletotrichum destructivum]
MTAAAVTGGDPAKRLNEVGRGKAVGDRVRSHGRPVTEDVSVEEAHKKLLQAWINDTKSGDEYKRMFEKRLKKNDDGQNIIHRAIMKFKKEPNVVSHSVLHEIESLVVEHPEFFIADDEYERRPMIEAAKHHIVMLFRVIDLLIPKNLLAEIDKVCKGDKVKCPLHKVSNLRRDQCRRIVGSEYDPKVDLPADQDQCLHNQIDVQKLVDKDKQLREHLEFVLKSENARLCLESLLNQNKFDPGQNTRDLVLPVTGFKALLELCPDELFSRQPKGAKESTPLQRAVKLYEAQNIDYDLLLSIIRALIDRHPESIFIKDSSDRNAYRLLKETPRMKAAQNISSRAQAEDLLKRKCISFPANSSTQPLSWRDEEKMWLKKSDFLYWDAETEHQFYLNLTGESETLNRSYIETIQDESGIRFETVLAFVKLPYWKAQEETRTADEVTAPGAGQNLSPNLPSRDEGHKAQDHEANPYPAIFDWLWAKGVRKIFTLDVDDDGPEPHTNAAIRKALIGEDSGSKTARDFRVEVWKWKKFDICAETVAISASRAKEIHLYSHGNIAVLRGWATSVGLAQLNKNLDDEMDCKEYEKEFKKTLLENIPRLQLGSIKITNHGFRRSNESDADRNRRNNGIETTRSHSLEKTLDTNQWIGQLKNFKSFVWNLPIDDTKKPRIKVALLDDGAKLTALHGKQQGRSFHKDKEEFFVGPCEHGTAMARCIREVCPRAELYIARLDDSRKVENQRFTIESCCQALQWALDMKVDIISISWTFTKKGNANDSYEKKFEDLVKKAALEKNIIIFGSLPDQANVKTQAFAPVGLDEVIKIGAATIYGEGSRQNLYAGPDFLLPGENLPSSTGGLVSGSSYATAYASGLAAIVLYCIKAFEAIGEYDEDEDILKAWSLAKKRDGMKAIFKTLSGKSPEYHSDSGLFVRPYHIFGQEFEKSPSSILRSIIQKTVLRTYVP